MSFEVSEHSGIEVSGVRGVEGEKLRGCQQSPCPRYDAIRSEMPSFAFI